MKNLYLASALLSLPIAGGVPLRNLQRDPFSLTGQTQAVQECIQGHSDFALRSHLTPTFDCSVNITGVSDAFELGPEEYKEECIGIRGDLMEAFRTPNVPQLCQNPGNGSNRGCLSRVLQALEAKAAESTDCPQVHVMQEVLKFACGHVCAPYVPKALDVMNSIAAGNSIDSESDRPLCRTQCNYEIAALWLRIQNILNVKENAESIALREISVFPTLKRNVPTQYEVAQDVAAALCTPWENESCSLISSTSIRSHIYNVCGHTMFRLASDTTSPTQTQADPDPQIARRALAEVVAEDFSGPFAEAFCKDLKELQQKFGCCAISSILGNTGWDALPDRIALPEHAAAAVRGIKGLARQSEAAITTTPPPASTTQTDSVRDPARRILLTSLGNGLFGNALEAADNYCLDVRLACPFRPVEASYTAFMLFEGLFPQTLVENPGLVDFTKKVAYTRGATALGCEYGDCQKFTACFGKLNLATGDASDCLDVQDIVLPEPVVPDDDTDPTSTASPAQLPIRVTFKYGGRGISTLPIQAAFEMAKRTQGLGSFTDQWLRKVDNWKEQHDGELSTREFFLDPYTVHAIRWSGGEDPGPLPLVNESAVEVTGSFFNASGSLAALPEPFSWIYVTPDTTSASWNTCRADLASVYFDYLLEGLSVGATSDPSPLFHSATVTSCTSSPEAACCKSIEATMATLEEDSANPVCGRILNNVESLFSLINDASEDLKSACAAEGCLGKALSVLLESRAAGGEHCEQARQSRELLSSLCSFDENQRLCALDSLHTLDFLLRVDTLELTSPAPWCQRTCTRLNTSLLGRLAAHRAAAKLQEDIAQAEQDNDLSFFPSREKGVFAGFIIDRKNYMLQYNDKWMHFLYLLDIGCSYEQSQFCFPKAPSENLVSTEVRSVATPSSCDGIVTKTSSGGSRLGTADCTETLECCAAKFNQQMFYYSNRIPPTSASRRLPFDIQRAEELFQATYNWKMCGDVVNTAGSCHSVAREKQYTLKATIPREVLVDNIKASDEAKTLFRLAMLGELGRRIRCSSCVYSFCLGADSLEGETAQCDDVAATEMKIVARKRSPIELDPDASMRTIQEMKILEDSLILAYRQVPEPIPEVSREEESTTPSRAAFPFAPSVLALSSLSVTAIAVAIVAA